MTERALTPVPLLPDYRPETRGRKPSAVPPEQLEHACRLLETGKIPGKGIIEAEPVTITIDGEEVVAAYDIRIYANEIQRAEGRTWQPADQKVQVHFFDEAFTGRLNIYHIDGEMPEYVTTVEAREGWVEFEADRFSIYAVTRSIEKTITIGGNTYHITVAYGQNAGVPEGAELHVEEVSGEKYLSETAAVLECGEEDAIFYTKFLDISLVYEGERIEPETPVDVTVELLDVEDGAQALEVIHFTDTGARKVESQADENGVVRYSTDEAGHESNIDEHGLLQDDDAESAES